MKRLEELLKIKFDDKLNLEKDPYDLCYKALIGMLAAELLYYTTRFISEYIT